jgi:hypothetical protein
MTTAGDTPEEFDDARDFNAEMIAWLEDKDPDVWHEVAQNLNWDSATGVIDWLIAQRRLDRATAAHLFAGTDPAYYIREATINPDSEFYQLLAKILRNWKSNFYKRSELAWDESWEKRYRDAVAARRDKRDPFNIPPELLGPIRGRKTQVPPELRVENNVQLYDLFYGLGSSIGFRPGSARWHQERDPVFQKKKKLSEARAAILWEVRDTLRFYARCAPWLALFFVVAVGAALILRYINKGVVF